MPKPLTVDPKVHELAEHWLSADATTRYGTAAHRKRHEARVLSLASDIQRAIESWCEDEADYHAQQADHDAELRSLRHLSDTERERI